MDKKHYCKVCNEVLEIIVYEDNLGCYDSYLYCDKCDKEIQLDDKEEYYIEIIKEN